MKFLVGAGQAFRRPQFGQQAGRAFAISLLLIVPPVCSGDFLVIAREWLVCLVRNPSLQHLDVKDADEAVSTADITVEESKRLTGLYAFDPHGNLGQLHGHWISIHPVDAVASDIAHGCWIIWRFAAPQERNTACHSARRPKKKMAGTACWIDHGKSEDCLCTAFGLGAFESWIEHAIK